MKARLALCLLPLLAIHTAVAAPAPELTVFAAASLTESLQEIGAAYEKAGGPHVAFNFGASSTLARQIAEGAPADVFFSADEAKMDGLAHHGLVIADTRRSPLSNSLVFVVAADSSLRIASPRDLLGPKVRVVALAEPQSVPAGIYAKEYLRSVGVWSDMIDKVVPTENVRGALAAVEAGNADAAIVYKTDAAISSKVKVALEVAPADGPKISYPVAVLTHAPQLAEARRFIDYLTSAPALEVFRNHGFIVQEQAKTP
jgi:molybdate transport system substrate-binding protein